MSRRPFNTPEARIVVSTDGYFDVYAPGGGKPNARPSYRGALAELGPSVRGQDDRLSVRPDSGALDTAVSVWSSRQGAAAVGGKLGLGRNDGEG